MKKSIFVVCVSLLSLFPAFGEISENKKSDLFNFPAPAPVEVKAQQAPVEVVPEAKEEAKADAKAEEKSDKETSPALVADAQTLIKDKLVQKYQVRLDEVISRMTSRMNGVSAEEQREALGDLRDRIAEKKDVVSDMKDLDPLKKDILLAILDHVIHRLDGLIKQSAQMETQAKQA